MSRYRKLMSEAMAEVEENSSDYLKSRLNDRQIQNIKNTWKNKKASDVTQSVKDMIKKMDIPTQLAIKQADIPHLSALVENTEEQIDEGRMKDIYTMDQAGKSAEEIAKKLKVSVATVKGILGEKRIRPPRNLTLSNEEVEDLQEFSRSQLDALQKQYASLKGKTISIDNANKLRKIFDRIPDHFLNDLRKRHIPFLSGLALSRMIQKKMPVREDIEDIQEARWRVEGSLSYKNSGDYVGFHMVIDAPTKPNINRVQKELDQARAKRKIGPTAHSGRVEDVDISNIERTSDRLEAPSDYAMEQKEENESAFEVSGVENNGRDLQEKEDKDAPATDSTDTDGKIPPIKKDNKPGVKIAKIRAQRDAGDDQEVAKKEDELKKAKDEVIMLKTKLENEKNKAVKPAPNKETGEVPLAVGLAQKLIRDKMQKQTAVPTEKKEGTIFNMWKEAAKIKSDDKEVDKDLEDFEEELGEQKQYQKLMLTYGKPGGQAMVYYTDYMQDLQNRAQEFRKKGYIIGKMGRSVPMNQLPKKMPMKGKEIKEDNIEEKFTIQITKKDGGKFVHGSYKTKPEAEKIVKWYKTGDVRTTKKIEIIPEDMGKDLPEDKDPCWKNYKMVGMKDKGGKKVPNCVPEDTELDERDGANTSSRKGSVWRAAMKRAMKRNYMRPVKRRR